MNYLFDTHALLWAISDPPKLGKAVRRVLEGRGHVFYASAASAWEIAIKVGLGKLDFPIDDLAAALSDAQFAELPITLAHAVGVRSLPPHHLDPFDRLLVAQALAEGLVRITRDEALAAYKVSTLWD